MAATASQVCLAVILSIPSILGGYIKEYPFHDYCGRSISMGLHDHAIKLNFINRTYYQPNMDCLVHIVDKWIYPRNLTAQFIDIGIDCTDAVQLFMSPFGVKQEYCGKSKPSPYVTSGSDLYVQFASDNSSEDRGFTLLVNSFHTGICNLSEFECDNGRCLDYDLKEDGYDNCGDYSDENAIAVCYAPFGTIVGIVVFLAICVVITVLCCCCCCKKKTTGQFIKQGTQPPAYTDASGPIVYPPPQSATPGWELNPIMPPPYSEKINPWYATPTNPSEPLPVGVKGAYQPGTQPPAYTEASGPIVYPPQSTTPGWEPSQTVPPPYSEKK